MTWDIKRMCQVMPKKDGPIWDITKTCHRNLGLMNVKFFLAWTIYFHINRILFSSRILLSGATLHNWRPDLARMILSIWKPSKTYTWRWSTYILFHSNLNTALKTPFFADHAEMSSWHHDVTTWTWIKRTYLHHLCNVLLVGR